MGLEMQGRIDGVDGSVLRAWAWDPGAPNKHLTVYFLIDDYKTENVIGNFPRKDLEKAGIGAGDHGIRLDIPKNLFDGSVHKISLCCDDGVGGVAELARREIFLDRRQVVYQGRVERFSQGRCVGWVRNVEDPRARVNILAVWGSEVVGEFVADRMRKDLVAAGFGDGNYGFEIKIPVSLWRSANSEMNLEVHVVNGPLLGKIPLPTADVVRNLVEAGRQAERSGDTAAAIQSLDKAIRISGDNVDALWIRARIAAGQGDTEKAREYARRAYELHPSHTRAAIILARISQIDAQYEEALGYWRDVPEGDTAYRESLVRSAQILQRLGRQLEALQIVQKIFEMNRHDVDGIKIISQIYLDIGAPSLAVPYLQAMLESKPDDKKVAQQFVLATSSRKLKFSALPLEFLVNPTLASWEGTAAGTLDSLRQVANGVFLGPASAPGSVSYRVCDPQEFRAGELPHYAIDIASKISPADIGFQLDKKSTDILSRGLRVSIEIGAVKGCPVDIDIYIAIRNGDECIKSRILANFKASPGFRISTFDLILDSEECARCSLEETWIVLRLGANQAAVMRAPRPLMALPMSELKFRGLEGPSIGLYKN